MKDYSNMLDWGFLLLLLIVVMFTSWLMNGCVVATCDLEKEHIKGISCPPKDGSHGPCPFGCDDSGWNGFPLWLRQ